MICKTGTVNVGFNEDNMVVAYFKTFYRLQTTATLGVCQCDLT